MAVKKIQVIHCLTGKSFELRLDRDNITSMKEVRRASPGSPYIGPGLTDIQVNGYGGVDFNNAPLAPADAWHVARDLLAKGVTRFFPTVITNQPHKIISLLEQIHQACLSDPELERHIPGIHLEGPFISPEDGPRGAHDRRYVLAPDYSLFEKFQKAAGGRIKIITLSPEWDNAPAFIRKCVRKGVIVSIGHTQATPEQIREAVASGATMSTHLGNGAALMVPRHPNFIWEQLASDDLTAGIIADGHHLPSSFIKTAMRAKGNRIILVSDATMFAGMKPGVYESHIGGTVELQTSGRLCMKHNPAVLAGAALPLTAGIDFLINRRLATLPVAWSMASVSVNRMTGLPPATTTNLTRSDYIIFSRKARNIKVLKVFKSGKLIFPK